MRKLLVIALTLAVSSLAGVAHAGVTRDGLDYDGISNRYGCEIFPDRGALHVDCSKSAGATGTAYIRYRFLNDVGAQRKPAVVTAFIDQFIGQNCSVEWMVRADKNPARTLRVVVPGPGPGEFSGNYCHIRSVTWSQQR